MKVYVVECGIYSDRYVGGVYATPEGAMQANPVDLSKVLPHHKVRTDGWVRDGDGTWSNGLDFDDCKTIEEYEVIGLDSLAS